MLFKRLTIFSLAMLSFSQAAAQIMLPQDEADKHRTNLLVSKINQQVSRVVPRTLSGIPPEQKCHILFPAKNQNQDFSINAKRSPIRISLPHNFESWALRKEMIFPFVHTYLSARTGSRIPLKDAWITAAIIHDLYGPGTLYGTAGFKHSPYTRTMTAYGYVPSLQNILNSEMPDFYGHFDSAVRMEWCSLLLKQTLKRANSFEKILFYERSLKPAERFEKLLSTGSNAQKGKTFFGTREQTPQEWFETACTRAVLGRGIPASVPWIEESFNSIMEPIRPHLKVPETQKGKKVPVLSNEAIKALAQAEMKLNFLALIAPEQTALKLYRCAGEIREFRMKPPTQNAIKKIHAEEKVFYTALSERAALEQMLKRAEQKLTTPGMRFALTLQVYSPAKPEIPLLKKANSLMDRYE